jgi:hypothetical protein
MPELPAKQTAAPVNPGGKAIPSQMFLFGES